MGFTLLGQALQLKEGGFVNLTRVGSGSTEPEQCSREGGDCPEGNDGSVNIQVPRPISPSFCPPWRFLSPGYSPRAPNLYSCHTALVSYYDPRVGFPQGSRVESPLAHVVRPVATGSWSLKSSGSSGTS